MALSVRYPLISIRPIRFNILNQSLPFNLKNSNLITIQQRGRRIGNLTITNAIEKKREETESSEIQQFDESPENESESETKTGEATELGLEIKKAMEERKKKEMETGGNFWNGVLEEVKEIEWPAFGKVVGTTGVVLGVIAGSSVVLLTVNAVLAELSDRVFAGKGVQDFFS